MNLSKKFCLKLVIISVISTTMVYNLGAGEYEIASKEIDTHHLITPYLDASDIIDCKVGLRPYRTSGLRLEVEQVGPKLLVHDYGHGGSGLSLSWGCAEVAVDLMKDELVRLKRQSTKKIAIVGAGIIGLTTAYILLSRGYSVTLYTKDTTPNTTSDLASGIVIGSFHITAGTKPGDQERLNRATSISLAKFKELVQAKEPTIKGVSYANFYGFDKTPEMIQKDFSAQLVWDIKMINVHFDTGIIRKALFFKHIVLDTSLYMNDLFSKVQAMGAVVKQQTIKTIDDLLALPETVVHNCMGLGAAAVLDDKDLMPLKGVIVYVKPRQGINYVLAAKPEERPSHEFINYSQWHDRGIVGGTLIEGDWNDLPDQEIQDIVMNNMRKFVAFPKETSYFPAV